MVRNFETTGALVTCDDPCMGEESVVHMWPIHLGVSVNGVFLDYPVTFCADENGPRRKNNQYYLCGRVHSVDVIEECVL